MTEEELSAVCAKVGEATIDLYEELCKKISKPIVLTGMIGALVSCCVTAEIARDRVIAAVNSVFDDIEGVEK